MADMTTEYAPIAPDTKDWTWVLDRACPDCGFDAATVATGRLGAAIRDNAAFWAAALADPRAGERPAPDVWSPTEYGAHVRDVHRVFAGRLEQMLTEDDPLFANWDQDDTARVERYDEQVAADVLPDDAWGRPGRRSNGSVFTVETLGRYHLHDLVHHRWDVRWIMGG
jgi:hypothetical protein